MASGIPSVMGATSANGNAMSEDDFTAEETAAMEAMQQADTPQRAPETPEEQAKAIDAERGEPVAVEDGKYEEQRQQKDARQEDDRRVPYGALHAEREARKALQAQLEELKAWKEAQENPPAPEPQYVDPLEDPEGFRKYYEHQTAKTREPFERLMQQQREAMEHQQRVQTAAALEAEFAKQTPDYTEAVSWLQNQRVSQLRSMGYDDNAIRQQIRQDALGVFNGAQQAGMNPAQLLYLRAQQAGFKPPAKVEAEQLQAQARAAEQTRTLGQSGGAPQSGKLTAAQLADMSDEEFARLSDDDLRVAMGG